MGKGNAEHGKSIFYVLPPGQANIYSAILSKDEWLNWRSLLYDEDPSHLNCDGSGMY
jgi:hypothetical protein